MAWPIRIGPNRRWPKGAWQGVYRDRRGKQRSAGIYARKRDAEKAAHDEEAKIRLGVWSDRTKAQTLFGAWVEAWKRHRTVRETTADVTDRRLTYHLLPVFGDVALGEITRGMIQEWVNDLADAGTSRDMITTYIALLSTVLNAAVDEDLIPKNPCRRISIPEGAYAGRAPLALTAVQAGWIVAALPAAERPMVLTGLGTGLRFGELAGLHETAVDLDRDPATLDVRHALKEIRGRRTQGPPKTAAGERGIPLPATVRDTLRKHLKDRPARQPDAAGYVFTSPKGYVLSRAHHRSDVWRPAVELSGMWPDAAAWTNPRTGKPVVPVTMHDLRSTYASLLENASVPGTAIQELLGHKGAGVTSRYLLASPETLARAMTVVDGFLREVLEVAEGAGPEVARRREEAAARRKVALRSRRDAARAGRPVAPLRGRKRSVEDPGG